MPKDTEIKPQDSGMSLLDLHNLLRNVLSKNPNRNKNFLKNELKIKPLIEVSKHSFDDACSSLAITDFKLLQGAYLHYLENPDCLTQETPIPSTPDSNKWKDSVFISCRNSNTAASSEDSDLEKALCDLQMSELCNNISDPEVLDLCNGESIFEKRSSFNTSVPVAELSPSVSFSPFQRPPIAYAQDSSEKIRLSEKFDLPHNEEEDQTEIPNDRGNETPFGKRKKCKKKKVLVRTLYSTDSSEMLSPPSEIHVNELETVENDLCFAEELNQDGLSTQEQKIDSTVLISPTTNNGASVSSSKKQKELRKSLKPNAKAKSTKKETKKCKELTQSSKDISEMPSPTKSLQTSTSRQGGDNNHCEGFQTCDKILSPPQDVFSTSEGQADKPSTNPKAVLQNQSPTISSQVVDTEKQTCKIGHETPKSRSATEMIDKLVSHTLKAKSPKSKSNPKEDPQQIPCEVNSGQTLKAKSPRSNSYPKEDTSQISCDTIVKDSLSLPTEAVKCNPYAIEMESDDVFENNDHITPNLSDSGFTESEKDGDKNSNISISPLDPSNYNPEAGNFFTEGTDKQPSSHSESRQKVDNDSTAAEVDKYKNGAPEVEDYNNVAPEFEDYNNVAPEVEDYNNVAPEVKEYNYMTPKVETPNQSAGPSIDDLLDYEYDGISDPEDATPFRKSPEGEADSYSADEDIHSTGSCYSEVTGGDTPGQEMCPTSEIISNQHTKNVSCLTNPLETNYNAVPGDPTEGEIGVARKVPWDPPKLTRKRRMSSSSDDDDSSASDSETSYKRRKDSSPSQTQQRKENVRPSSCSKLDAPEPRLRNFSSVIRDIEICCDNHDILKAVNSALEYLKISNRPTCLKIYQEIFLGIRDSVRLTGGYPEDPLMEIVEHLKSFVEISNPDNRDEDIKLCSMIVFEYFQVPVLIRYALDLCCYLQNKAVPIRNRAIVAYATNAISTKAPTDIILNFLTYIKKICQLPVHQLLLTHVLQRVVKGKECYMLPEFSQLCELLCLLDAYEMERQPLQGLMKTCIENNCWDVFARLFIAWCDKQCFPTPFLEALQMKLDETGIRFKKFAADVFGAGEPSESTKYFFGIIGVTLIMDSCETGREKDKKTIKDYLVNSNDVLHTLHKYNIDIFRVTESFFRTILPEDPDPGLVLCLPYSVFFNLVEICLRLNLPQNAFQLYKNYSSYLNELPQTLNDEKKPSIRIMQFKQLIKVTQMLHLKDPLESGLSAFRNLMVLSKQEDILNELKTPHRINGKAIVDIFASLMVTCMNKSLTATLYQLYQYLSGSPWEPFVLGKTEVLRGLLVTFEKSGKMDEVRTLFNQGCANKFYRFTRPTVVPWELTLLSSYTNQEMKFVIEKYFHLLFPLLSKKKAKTKFEDFYTVKIAFKDVPSPPPKISCLIVPSVPTPLSRACSVIASINPDLKWTEHENFILLTPSTVYNHWIHVSRKKEYYKLQEKTFNASQRRSLVFGMNGDNEANLNLSRTPDTPAFSSGQSSSSQQSTPSFHYGGSSTDQYSSQNGFLHPNAILKRRISLNSSETSSSHTPECRTSVDQEPSRSDLRRSFERLGSSCDSGQVDNESPYPESLASKRRRIDSSDMSQLNNFYCRKVSPRKTPQLQYPVSSHQSQNNGLIQSQTVTASNLFPPQTVWNQLDRNPSHQLSSQTGWNQFDRNAGYELPPQTGRNQFDMSKPSNFTCSRTSPRNTSQRSTASSYMNTGLDQSQNTTPPLPHSVERFRSPVRQDRTRNNYVDSHTGSNFTVESHQLQQNTEPDRSRSQSSLTQSYGKMGSPKGLVTSRENFRVTQLAQFDSSDTSPNDYLSQYKNISSRPPLLMSPPNHFASPYPSDESELSLNKVKRNLNVDIVKNTAPTITGLKSPHKQKVTRVISNVQNADLSNETFNDLIASHKNNTFIPINDKPTTSLKNHSPAESLFTVPQNKNNLKAKRRLNLYREPSTPKLPPYKIQTPCKDAVKVIRHRPITPVVKSAQRCKTPLMFNTKKMSQNFKQPKVTKSCSSRELLPVTVSFRNNSISRTVITAPSNVEQAPKKAGKFTCITTQPLQMSSGPSNNSRPFPQQTNFKPPGAVTGVPPDVFQRISTFLKSQILLKCKSLNNVEIQEKATTLANTFVKNYSVKQLDGKTMKLLCKFVETIK